MERLSHWNQVYQSRLPENTSWYQPVPEKSLSYITRFARPGTRIIDIGGGASSLVDHLLALGHQQLAVVDVSPVALTLSKIRLSDRSPEVDWIVADVATRPLLPAAHLWHDRATLHFLTQSDELATYAELAAETVTEGGFMVLGTFATDGPEKCSGLPVRRYDSKALRRVFDCGFELVEEDREIHRTPAGHEQAFQWTVFRRLS